MSQTFLDSRLLPLAVLALAAYAAYAPHPPAWQWMLVAALLLATVILVLARVDRQRVLSEPVTIKTGVFILSRVLMPFVVLFSGLAALLTTSEGFFELAIVMAITLAVVSLF